MLTEFGMKSPDELYEKIGLGERLAPLIARRLLLIDDPASAERDACAIGHRGEPKGW